MEVADISAFKPHFPHSNSHLDPGERHIFRHTSKTRLLIGSGNGGMEIYT